MITDTFLNTMAALINGETSTIPAYNSWSSTAITLDPTDTELTGEFGSRTSISNQTRTNNAVLWESIRVGATIGSAGDRINSMGLNDTSTAGNLFAEALVSSLLQTSDFDLELNWRVQVERKT